MAHEYYLVLVDVEDKKQTGNSSQGHNYIRQPLKLLYLIINGVKKCQPRNQHKEIRKIREKVSQRIKFIPK